METHEVKAEYDIGVVIGRFQVPKLTENHKGLIDYVAKQSKQVIVLLGISPLKTTANNPLDYGARVRMIEEDYPDICTTHVIDCQDDEVWSGRIDQTLHGLVSPGMSVALYGGRDSFIKHYSGEYKTIELWHEGGGPSGTEIRESLEQGVCD